MQKKLDLMFLLAESFDSTPPNTQGIVHTMNMYTINVCCVAVSFFFEKDSAGF